MTRIVIVGLWLVMLGWLAVRSRSDASSPEPLRASASLSPDESWMLVYQQGQRVGFTHQTIRVQGSNTVLAEETTMRLLMLGVERSLRTTVRAEVGSAYELSRVEFTLRSGDSNFSARGEVSDKRMRLNLDFGAAQSEQSIDLTGPIFLPQSLRASLRGRDLRVGLQERSTIWDPLASQSVEMVLRVVAHEMVPDVAPPVLAWRIEEEMRGVRTTAWIGAGGEVLREEGPLGFMLRRSTEAEALAPQVSSGRVGDVSASAAVRVGEIADARQRSRLRLRIRGIDPAVIPLDAEQQLEGDVLTIRRPPLKPRDTYELPDRGGHQAELAATAFVQSDHPRIRGLARTVLAEEVDAQLAARRLNEWVYEYLEKVPTISVPNALEIIDSARGDCNEHAVLLAALARAVGLPTRIVAGLVYVDEVFLYHAWCEVWLGRWVSIDPAFNQFPADATHLKLIEGGPEEHAKLLPMVGKLALEALDEAR